MIFFSFTTSFLKEQAHYISNDNTITTAAQTMKTFHFELEATTPVSSVAVVVAKPTPFVTGTLL
jgi:hypothetical protein